ncbi:hypothetical protein B0H17DRAFT_1215517 [Mycena rosella]|uniref:Uncharacterized protein n=1 Tax=Mycena rosella TaxID=1033263 RepID=A0AAD7CHA3_MYCRO|nr:hypothetical protein B0H17DRAFT_1215517 [Mycena rosella]
MSVPGKHRISLISALILCLIPALRTRPSLHLGFYLKLHEVVVARPARYSEITPLRRTLTDPSPDPTAPPLWNGTWIWSTSDAAYDAAPGSVGFRKTFTSPVGRRAQSATILITVDNQFTMYVDEAYIGASQDWTRVQQLKKNLNATTNTLTVIAGNWATLNHDTSTWTDPSSAGVIAAIRIE